MREGNLQVEVFGLQKREYQHLNGQCGAAVDTSPRPDGRWIVCLQGRDWPLFTANLKIAGGQLCKADHDMRVEQLPGGWACDECCSFGSGRRWRCGTCRYDLCFGCLKEPGETVDDPGPPPSGSPYRATPVRGADRQPPLHTSPATPRSSSRTRSDLAARHRSGSPYNASLHPARPAGTPPQVFTEGREERVNELKEQNHELVRLLQKMKEKLEAKHTAFQDLQAAHRALQADHAALLRRVAAVQPKLLHGSYTPPPGSAAGGVLPDSQASSATDNEVNSALMDLRSLLQGVRGRRVAPPGSPSPASDTQPVPLTPSLSEKLNACLEVLVRVEQSRRADAGGAATSRRAAERGESETRGDTPARGGDTEDGGRRGSHVRQLKVVLEEVQERLAELRLDPTMDKLQTSDTAGARMVSSKIDVLVGLSRNALKLVPPEGWGCADIHARGPAARPRQPHTSAMRSASHGRTACSTSPHPLRSHSYTTRDRPGAPASATHLQPRAGQRGNPPAHDGGDAKLRPSTGGAGHAHGRNGNEIVAAAPRRYQSIKDFTSAYGAGHKVSKRMQTPAVLQKPFMA